MTRPFGLGGRRMPLTVAQRLVELAPVLVALEGTESQPTRDELLQVLAELAADAVAELPPRRAGAS